MILQAEAKPVEKEASGPCLGHLLAAKAKAYNKLFLRPHKSVEEKSSRPSSETQGLPRLMLYVRAVPGDHAGPAVRRLRSVRWFQTCSLAAVSPMGF